MSFVTATLREQRTSANNLSFLRSFSCKKPYVKARRMHGDSSTANSQARGQRNKRRIELLSRSFGLEWFYLTLRLARVYNEAFEV